METKIASAGEKVLECVKVSWMIGWRLLIAGVFLNSDGLLVLAFLGTPFISLGLILNGYSLQTFPLLRLISFKHPILRLNASRYKKTGYSPRTVSRPSVPTRKTIDRASQKGRRTGFEPYELKKLKLQKSPWIIGDPGFGLSASNFDDTSVRLGQAGERNFALSLQKAGLIDRFQSFWSCALPARNGFYKDPEYDTDVDCILFDGLTLYLIDLKNYKGGAVTYREERGELVCKDDATGSYLSISSKRSKNMSMALERFETHLQGSGVRIEARVVFMPTDSGIGKIEGVRWPGNIPAIYLPDFLQELSRTKMFTRTRYQEEISGKLNGLVKR